jgi:RNA polymerase sigma factor (sigma-70 family)
VSTVPKPVPELLHQWDVMHVKLRRFLFRYTRSWADAHDLVQELGARLVIQGSAREPGCARALVWKMARSVGADWCRKRQRMVPTVWMGEEELDEVPDERVCPETRAMYEQLLKQVLATLTPAQQRVLELKQSGHSYAEIAEETNVTTETVKSHLGNARRTIAEHFSQGGTHGRV